MTDQQHQITVDIVEGIITPWKKHVEELEERILKDQAQINVLIKHIEQHDIPIGTAH